MADPFIAEIRMFAGNFAPNGWALCNGQLMSISQYSALFSVLGTTYGGNGTTTFALPNLQCRVPLHWGNGAGLTPLTIGAVGGTESTTLNITQIPSHSHSVNASSGAADQNSPAGNVWAAQADSSGTPIPVFAKTTDSVMSAAAIGTAGGSQAHSNMQPYLAVTYIIALEGLYPSRP